MKLSRTIREQWEAAGLKPSGYVAALLEAADGVDGDAIYITDEANAKVHGREVYAPREPTAGGCGSCGGKSLVNLANDPAAMEAALRE